LHARAQEIYRAWLSKHGGPQIELPRVAGSATHGRWTVPEVSHARMHTRRIIAHRKAYNSAHPLHHHHGNIDIFFTDITYDTSKKGCAPGCMD